MAISHVLSPLAQNRQRKAMAEQTPRANKRPNDAYAGKRSTSNAENADYNDLLSQKEQHSSGAGIRTVARKGKRRDDGAGEYDGLQISPSKRISNSFDVFAPVRAMRTFKARAGIKRKRGGGPITTPRHSTLAKQHQSLSKTTAHNRPPSSTSTGGSSSAATTRAYDTVSDESPDSPVGRRGTTKMSRDNSHTSLRRNMRAMALTDRVSPGRSLSGSQERGRGIAVRSRGGSRKSSYNMTEMESDNEGEEIGEMEDERLLQQAPNWQLHRLKKSKLLRLNLLLSSTAPDQEGLDPDIFTKQELVDYIVKSRSVPQVDALASLASSTSDSSNRRASLRHSKSPESPTARRKSFQQVMGGSRASSVSADYTDYEPSETDANDGGGEETDAEQMRATMRRQEARRAHLAQPSPMVNRLRQGRNRTKSTPGTGLNNTEPSPLQRRLRASASTVFAASSPARTRSRARRQTSTLNLRRSLPTASTSCFPTDVGKRTRRDECIEAEPRTPVKAKRKGRGKRSAKIVAFRRSEHLNLSESEEADDVEKKEGEEWVDTSPSANAARPQRKAKLRAQEQMQIDETDEEQSPVKSAYKASSGSGSVADVEEERDNEDEQEFQPSPSEDDSVLINFRSKAKPAVRGQRKNNRPPPSSSSIMSLDEQSKLDENKVEEDGDLDNDDDFSEESESEVNASPSKIRKLRNGKLRIPSESSKPRIQGGAYSEEEGEDDCEDEEGDDGDEGREGEDENNDEYNDDDGNDTDMADGEIENDKDPMKAPTHGSLHRLRRDRLIELCDQNNVLYAEDATKVLLVEELLRIHLQHGSQQPPVSSATEKPGSSSTVRPSSGSSEDSKGRWGGKEREFSKNRRTSTSDSDTPLLLRSRSKDVQSTRPPPPKIQPDADEAQPVEANDELNGLDLESLNLVDKEIPPNKLEKMEKIGSGGFKDVYVGRYHISTTNKRRVAIADIRDHLTEMDIKEIKLLRDLRHENIVRFIGVSIPQEPRSVPCMIVSELCSNGDLFDYIRNVPPPNDDEIFRIMLEMARGLEYLHTRTPAIIHRDCKSTNVLVTRNRTAKINDFGLARVRNTKRSKIGSLVGTVNWQAAELWTPKPNYNEKVDVWSAAMTFWETLQWHQPEKKYPFQDMNEHQIYQDVGQKKLRPSTISIRRKYGAEVVELLDKMWDQAPKNRPTMTEVCQELERLVEMKRETQRAIDNVLSNKPTTRTASAARS